MFSLFQVPSSVETYFAYRSGIIILAHNQSTRPISLFGGTFVSSGAETFIGIKRSFITKQEKPYTDCINDLTSFSAYSKRLFGFFKDLDLKTYDQHLCSFICFQDKLIDKCGCASAVIDSIRDAPYCESPDELDCEAKFTAYFSAADTNKICENVCREKCEYQLFDLSVKTVNYPLPKYLQYLASFQNFGNFTRDSATLEAYAKKAVIRVNINYEGYTYTLIEERAATSFEQLLGNVGGQLGLFIGISLLSLIECVEITIELIFLYFERKARVASASPRIFLGTP
jgi:amiloride-sensitive sodium channel subunit gamma